MTPAEYVDGVIATDQRDLTVASGAASDILVANGIDPSNVEHRRLVAIGVILGSSVTATDEDVTVDGFVRALCYGMEPAA